MSPSPVNRKNLNNLGDFCSDIKEPSTNGTTRTVSDNNENSSNEIYGSEKNFTLHRMREDVMLWMQGMVFIGLISWIVFIAGDVRKWDAPSGYTHNVSVTSQDRFQAEPYEADFGVRGRYGPDAPGRWYYWKLKSTEVTLWTRLFPWLGYVLHQSVMWTVIYKAQTRKESLKFCTQYIYQQGISGDDKFSSSVLPLNWFALVANILFALLHYINTQVTYDALAQDVSIASTQSSVVVILIFILIMDYKERGIFMGWPSPNNQSLCSITRSLTLSYEPSNLVRRYHGYAFSWAATFTFWYHPMENTWGHVTGAVYCLMILVQGSLIYTKLHINVYWRQLLELWVIVHAYVVAAQTGGPEMLGTRLWPMFTFGFAMVWIITQIHGLPIFMRARNWIKYLPLLGFFGTVLWAYSWIPNRQGKTWVRIHEIFRLPVTMYIYFMFGWMSLIFLIRIQQKLEASKQETTTTRNRNKRHVLFIVLAVLVYILEIVLAIAAEYLDIKMRLTTLSFIFDAIFTFFCAVSFTILDEAMSCIKPLKQTVEHKNNLNDKQK